MEPIMAALRWWLTKELDLETKILERNIERGEEFLQHPYTAEEAQETREAVLGWIDRKAELVIIRDNMRKENNGDS